MVVTRRVYSVKLYCVHSDEGLTLEISVLETLHGCQFTLSTQLIKYKFEKKANYDDAPFTRKKNYR